jgi:hypothetical protein
MPLLQTLQEHQQEAHIMVVDQFKCLVVTIISTPDHHRNMIVIFKDKLVKHAVHLLQLKEYTL